MKYWPSYCTRVQLKRPRAINELSVRVFCFILYQVVLMRVLTFTPSTLIFVLCLLAFGPCMVTNACCACFPSMNCSTCRHCGCHRLHLALVNASLIHYAILCVSLHYKPVPVHSHGHSQERKGGSFEPPGCPLLHPWPCMQSQTCIPYC